MYYLIATNPANPDPANAPKPVDNSQEKQKELEDINKKDYNKNDPAKNNENELSIRDDSVGEVLIDSFLLISIFATIAFLIYRISGMPRPKVVTVNDDDEDDNTIIIRKRPRKRRIIIRNDEPRPRRRIIIRN